MKNFNRAPYNWGTENTLSHKSLSEKIDVYLACLFFTACPLLEILANYSKLEIKVKSTNTLSLSPIKQNSTLVVLEIFIPEPFDNIHIVIAKVLLEEIWSPFMTTS